MTRRRTFAGPVWGPLTYSQNFSSSSFIGTTGVSGSSYVNLNNIGGSNSTTYAGLTFSTAKQKTSGFEFKFNITEADINVRAGIDSIKIDFKWGFTGSLGNGGSAAGCCYIYGPNGSAVYTSNKFTQSSVNVQTYTLNVNNTVWNRDNLSTIKIVFEATAGNGKYNNPTVQFYGATITVNYHLRTLEE